MRTHARTHARTLGWALLTASLTALLGGCGDDLPKATLIEQMRILGVTLDVVGDTGRATPKPGEDVRARFEVVFPTEEGTTDDTQLLILSCTGPNQFTGGTPVCQEFIDAARAGGDRESAVTGVLSMARKVRCRDIPGGRFSAQGVTVQCVDGPPEVILPVRDDFAASNLLFLGVLCERGDAFVDPTDPGLFGCDDNDGETRPLNGLIPVQLRPEDENHNPDPRELSIELDVAKPWAPAGATLPPEDECLDFAMSAGPMLPHEDRYRHELTLRIPFDAASRELLDAESDTHEPLEITVHATDGKMERRYTLFDDTDVLSNHPDTGEEVLADSLEWRPTEDEELPDGGKLVRFFVTIRDQRGGFARVDYALCIAND